MRKIRWIGIMVFLLIFVLACSNKEEVPNNNDSEVDIDLTTLSNTMVYAQMNKMKTNPEDYLGKTIKVYGCYQTSYYNQTSNYYHFVTVQDSLGCCSQSIEFVWEGDHEYPDDYPKNGKWITIEGIYSSYVELDIIYYYILVKEL